MMLHRNDKDIIKKLKAADKADLEAYCKEQGFTKEQTKVFVENSLKTLYGDKALDE